MTIVSSLSTGEWLIRFMLLPLAVIALIWFLWALAGWIRRGANRPGEPLGGDPLWVNAPREGTPAVSAGDVTDEQGGASARW